MIWSFEDFFHVFEAAFIRNALLTSSEVKESFESKEKILINPGYRIVYGEETKTPLSIHFGKRGNFSKLFPKPKKKIQNLVPFFGSHPPDRHANCRQVGG
jgi:uncharacterized Fe-S center protein